MKIIGECAHNGQMIVLERNNNGKFYIVVDGTTTQKGLTAEEMGRWFLNTLNQNQKHISINNQTDDDLRKESDELLKQGKRIEAIKYVRDNRPWRLKEGLNYIKQSKYY